MKQSVEAYLKRLPQEKVQELWEEWVLNSNVPPHISSELVEILKQRMEEYTENKTIP